jgi:hypothetical protein
VIDLDEHVAREHLLVSKRGRSTVMASMRAASSARCCTLDAFVLNCGSAAQSPWPSSPQKRANVRSLAAPTVM